MSRSGQATPEAAIWQDVEFGSYTADLPIWDTVAKDANGPVLELGAGAGRVSVHLAGSGVEVVAVERDPALASELERRASRLDLPITVWEADVRNLGRLDLGVSPDLAIAPLHLVQQLEPDDRPSLLDAVAELLGDEGLLAVTLVDEASFLDEGVAGPAAEAAHPDMRDADGWVYSSEPLWVQVAEATLTVRRLRQVVSPEGDITRRVEDELLHRLLPERFEQEAAAAGFDPVERRPIGSGPREADSVAVVVRLT